ncbi:MAG: hypothetical protein PHO91_00200 [Patescibacteria group bacterium]|nr:hypothetical protein [Patescibacteria group bacterium]
MNLTKRFLVFALMLTTVLWSLGGLKVDAAGSYGAGSLLALQGAKDAAVYYIGSDGRKYVFPDAKTYFTWYENFNDVVRVSVAELDMYPDGGAVTYRAGTKLITHENTARVYAVEPGGVIRWIPTAEVASNLYGANWASRVMDVIPGYFSSSYVAGSDLGSTHPIGTLLQVGSDIYYVSSSSQVRPFADADAFEVNGFKYSNVISVPNVSGWSMGSSITGEEVALSGFMPAEGSTPVTPAGGLTLSMSANNPVSATIISDDSNTAQALVPFLAVNLTASSAGSVRVTQMKFERTGISADSDIRNAYLYYGSERLVEGGSLSSKILTFNDTSASGIITIPAGATRTVWLKADLEVPTSASKTIGFNLTEVVSNASSLSGSYPLVGNVMSTAQATDLGYAVITGTMIPTGTVEVNSDEKDFEAFKISLTATDQDLHLHGLRLTKIGSIGVGDVDNFRLQVAGVTIGTATMNADGEVFFDLSNSPYAIAKGNTRTLSMVIDIVKGSTRTFKFDVRDASDIIVKDMGYGVFTQSFTSGSTSWSALTASGQFEIQAGTLSIVRDNTSPSGQVAAKATNVKLATFKVEASGEDVRVRSLNVKATTSIALNGGLQNGKVYFDGVQVGSTRNLTEDTDVNFTFGSSLIVPAGTAKMLDIYADIKTATGVDITSGLVKVEISAGNDAQGQVSLQTVTVPGAEGNTLTVTESALSMAKFAAYGNQNVTSPALNARIGAFTVSAGATEGIDVNVIYLSGATSGEVSNVKLMQGTTELATRVTMPTSGTTTFNVGNKLSLNAGQSKVVDVYADVKSGLPSAVITLVVAGEGTSKVTNTNQVAAGDTLQTMAIAAGAVTANAAGSRPDATIVVAGLPAVTLNAVEFSATNEAHFINTLQITGASGVAATISRVVLEYPTKTGTATAYGYLDGSGVAQFYNLGMYVAKDSTAVLTVKADLTTIANQGGVSGNSARLDLVASTGSATVFSAQGESSGVTGYTYTGGPVNGNSMIVRATKPTITLAALPTTILAGGTQTISRFTVTADAVAPLSWRQISFTTASSIGVTIDANSVKLYKQGDSSALNESNVSWTPSGSLITVTTTQEQTIAAGASQTYELKAGIGLDGSGYKQLSTYINASAAAATAGTSTTYTLISLYETGFIWSDRSAVPHLADGTSSDWLDSTYVKNLPTDTQTIAVTL